MAKVFVLNAHSRHGLVSIRCLGGRGVDVTAGSSRRFHAGRLSRYVDRFVAYPSPVDAPAAFVRAVEAELQRADYDMLLPVNEVTVETVVRHRDRFEAHTTVPFLPYDRLAVGLDKRRTIEAARAHDVPHPETRFAEEFDIDTVGEELGYPVVVKPTLGSSRNGVSVCHSRTDLERSLRETPAQYRPLLVQEFVPFGREVGVYTLYDCSGTLTGLTVQKRLRSNPPEGGASTYRETIRDPELVALADEFLTALEWRGLAMVEFRIDADTGEPKLLEINPRLWGSLALSVYAGVDFPYLLYRLAIGDDVDPQLEYAVGVRARCLFTDAQQVLAREDRTTALVEFLTPSSKPCCYDIVSKRDPLPTLGHLAYVVSCLFDRGNDTASDAGGGVEDSSETLPELPPPLS
ncbi:MAG: ATP-grasp domain-containing protein [Natronomonas sp.]